MAQQIAKGKSPVVLGQTPLESFHIADVVRNSGVIERDLKIVLPRDGVLKPHGQALVVLYWPQDWSFFSLKVGTEGLDSATNQEAPAEFQGEEGDPFAKAFEVYDDGDDDRPRDDQTSSFVTSQDGLYGLLTKFLGFDASNALQTAEYFTKRHRFVAGTLHVPTCLVLNIEIDTDNQKFITWSRSSKNELTSPDLPESQRQNGECVLLPRISILKAQIDKESWKNWLGEKGRLDKSVAVYLGKVKDLAQSSGILGFDIGNNNSTIAFLHNDAAGDHTWIKLLQADPIFDEDDENHRESSVLSTVRVTRYKANSNNRNFPLAEWYVGSEAVEISELGNGQVFHGAKRILGDLSRYDEPLSLVLDELHSIPRSLPAELLITKMSERVHQLLQMRTDPVVATYPSTYTKAEIAQVRFAISKALHRCLNFFDVNDRTAAKRGIGLVPRMYDEASAAAFFYLYRDFMRGPGRLHGFHFLYPRGVNLLLCDCGGGTTDIALIHARTVPDGKFGGDAMWGVHLTNLGRTGNRYFGGDNITSAFFRVIKWHLAAAIDGSLRKPLQSQNEIPDDPGTKLDELAADIDRTIPTRISRNRRVAVGSSMAPREKRRAQAVRGLWDWSERIKAWISSGKTGNFPTLAGGHALEKYVAETNKIADSIVRKSWDEIEWKWDLIRETVDRIIKPEIDITIDSANALIGELNRRLQSMSTEKVESDAPPAFVHHVYLVGRASHYPYFRDRLNRDLKMPFLSAFEELNVPDRVTELAKDVSELGVMHPRLVFDIKNLKGAVVRGAVLMRMAENSIRGARVVYDEQLSERLPFAIGHDSDVVAPEILFHEHSRYDELPSVELKAPEVAAGNPADVRRQTLVLHRRWPGTLRWEPFLEFSFQPPVAGHVIVRYNNETGDPKTLGFEVVHKESGAPAKGRAISRQSIVSPLERGDL